MIIFSDLSDVLIEGIGKVSQVVIERFGKEVGEKYWKHLHDSKDDFKEVLCGRISEAEFCRRFASSDDWPFEASDIQEIFTQSFRKKIPVTIQVYQDIVAHPKSFLDSTIINGRPDIYIVSDHIKERVVEIKKDHPDIFEFTVDQFWSCEIGKIKQDEGFFLELLEELGLDTREVIFVDDNNLNIEAASKVGIVGIQFENAKQLKSELKKYGFGFGKDK